MGEISGGFEERRGFTGGGDAGARGAPRRCGVAVEDGGGSGEGESLGPAEGEKDHAAGDCESGDEGDAVGGHERGGRGHEEEEELVIGDM